MARFEYNWVQQLLNNPWWLFGGQWQPSASDVYTRPVDTRSVAASTPVSAPNEFWAECPIEVNPGAGVWLNSMGGLPIQQARSDANDSWTVINPWLGYEVRPNTPLPLPKAGERWVEGHPNIGGAWDRHWVGLLDDGTFVEAIMMDPVQRTIGEVARWSKDGKLIAGRSVTAGDLSLGQHLRNRNDAAHVGMLVLSDYGGMDGSMLARDWAFPRVGQHVRLGLARYNELMVEATTPEQRVWLQSARDYGWIIGDRSTSKPGVISAKEAYVAGAQWSGSSVPQLNNKVKLKHLEVVTRTA